MIIWASDAADDHPIRHEGMMRKHGALRVNGKSCR